MCWSGRLEARFKTDLYFIFRARKIRKNFFEFRKSKTEIWKRKTNVKFRIWKNNNNSRIDKDSSQFFVKIFKVQKDQVSGQNGLKNVILRSLFRHWKFCREKIQKSKKHISRKRFPVFSKFIKTSISILYQNPIAGKIFIFLEAQTFKSLFKHLSNHPLRPSSPSHAATLPPLQSGENVFEKFRLFPLIPPLLVGLWLRPLSLSLFCVQARRRTRLAPGKGRVEPLNYVSERKKGWGGWIQARRLGRVYKYVLLARCRGGSPDLPVNFVIPFATPPPLSNPRLSAPTLLEITEAYRRRNRRWCLVDGVSRLQTRGWRKVGRVKGRDEMQRDWIGCV